MLKQYGPNVPEAALKKLVAAFGELRDMADRGLISYPYSTREVVNIVKHLEVSRVLSEKLKLLSRASISFSRLVLLILWFLKITSNGLLFRFVSFQS